MFQLNEKDGSRYLDRVASFSSRFFIKNLNFHFLLSSLLQSNTSWRVKKVKNDGSLTDDPSSDKLQPSFVSSKWAEREREKERVRGMKGDKKILIEAKSGKVCWRQRGGEGGARVLYRPRYARTSAAATN